MRDPEEFRKRFARWKSGENYWKILAEAEDKTKDLRELYDYVGYLNGKDDEIVPTQDLIDKFTMQGNYSALNLRQSVGTREMLDIYNNESMYPFMADTWQRFKKSHPDASGSYMSYPIVVKKLDKNTDGSFSPDSGIFINSKRRQNIDNIEKSVVHELRHQMDWNNLSNSGIYNKNSADDYRENHTMNDWFLMLDSGYKNIEKQYTELEKKYIKDAYGSWSNTNDIKELIPTNTEIRYLIYKDNNKAVGEDLNNIIKKMPINELNNYLHHVNGYLKLPEIPTKWEDKVNFYNKIKNALINVAQVDRNIQDTDLLYAKDGKDSNNIDWNDTINFITLYEGFSPTVYQKRGDKPTIGYGTTNLNWIKRRNISRKEAKQAMMEDLIKNELVLRRNIKNYDNYTDSAKVVLRDILYNIGEGNMFKKSPKFVEALQNMDYKEAARQMDWDNNKVGFSGAKKRNAARAEAWLNSIPIVKPKDPKYTTNQDFVEDIPQWLLENNIQFSGASGEINHPTSMQQNAIPYPTDPKYRPYGMLNSSFAGDGTFNSYDPYGNVDSLLYNALKSASFLDWQPQLFPLSK